MLIAAEDLQRSQPANLQIRRSDSSTITPLVVYLLIERAIPFNPTNQALVVQEEYLQTASGARIAYHRTPLTSTSKWGSGVIFCGGTLLHRAGASSATAFMHVTWHGSA